MKYTLVELKVMMPKGFVMVMYTSSLACTLQRKAECAKMRDLVRAYFTDNDFIEVSFDVVKSI